MGTVISVSGTVSPCLCTSVYQLLSISRGNKFLNTMKMSLLEKNLVTGLRHIGNRIPCLRVSIEPEHLSMYPGSILGLFSHRQIPSTLRIDCAVLYVAPAMKNFYK